MVRNQRRIIHGGRRNWLAADDDKSGFSRGGFEVNPGFSVAIGRRRSRRRFPRRAHTAGLVANTWLAAGRAAP